MGGWGFRRIEIFCAADNAASRGVPAKLGLIQEYRGRQTRWGGRDGTGWEDSLGWGVLSHEWDTERHATR